MLGHWVSAIANQHDLQSFCVSYLFFCIRLGNYCSKMTQILAIFLIALQWCLSKSNPNLLPSFPKMRLIKRAVLPILSIIFWCLSCHLINTHCLVVFEKRVQPRCAAALAVNTGLAVGEQGHGNGDSVRCVPRLQGQACSLEETSAAPSDPWS